MKALSKTHNKNIKLRAQVTNQSTVVWWRCFSYKTIITSFTAHSEATHIQHADYAHVLLFFSL